MELIFLMCVQVVFSFVFLSVMVSLFLLYYIKSSLYHFYIVDYLYAIDTKI